jgi:predicted metal-dependent phosphotriesterase family hydrolase
LNDDKLVDAILQGIEGSELSINITATMEACFDTLEEKVLRIEALVKDRTTAVDRLEGLLGEILGVLKERLK